jgi:short subunit dehydrogenase-like uncharacterized protein
MSDPLFIYGATGYTGRLIVEQAVASGLRPVLGGRDRRKLEALADSHGLEARAAELADAPALRAALRGARVVLNAAGPFSATLDPLTEACLAAGAHYLDITGELEVIERAARKHESARAAGVMLMPAVGFDVVPSDCLAAHVAASCAGARELRIAIAGLDLVSRGSARTILERVGQGIVVRRGGRLTTLPGQAPEALADFDFGGGPRRCAAVSWGDVASAFYTTGIPDVAVYFEATAPVRLSLAWERVWGGLAGRGPFRPLAERATALLPEGPSAARRGRQSIVLLAEARADGRAVRARLRTPEVYGFTAVTAVAIAARVLGGDFEVGFQTAARVYGADFVLSLPGVEREAA